MTPSTSYMSSAACATSLQQLYARPPRCRHERRAARLAPVAAEQRGPNSSGGPLGGGSGGPGGRRGRRGKAKSPGMFEVQDVTPPKRSLGIHALPPTTHNGDEIEVAGASYVVQSVVMQFKLVRGKYKQDHARLEVQHTGRYLYNFFLEDLYRKDSSHLSGEQDR